MSRYKNIIVAIDLYDISEEVLDKAAKFIGSDANFIVISADEPFPFYVDGSSPILGQNEKIRDECILQIQRKVKERGIPEDTVRVEVGKPAHVILDCATNESADLIIIGNRGRHGLQMLLGSTANAVLHRSKCDVLSVHINQGNS